MVTGNSSAAVLSGAPLFVSPLGPLAAIGFTFVVASFLGSVFTSAFTSTTRAANGDIPLLTWGEVLAGVDLGSLALAAVVGPVWRGNTSFPSADAFNS